MRELPLPYAPIDPMIEDSERMDAFLDALDLHDNPMAPWHVVSLLLHAHRHPNDRGSLGRVSTKKLAKICRWTGDPDALLDALLQSEWLVRDGDELLLEGWERHGGQVLKKREEHRERERTKKRRQRCAKAGHPEESCDCPGRVPLFVPGDKEGTDGDKAGQVEESRGPSPNVPVMKGEGRRVKGEDVLSSSCDAAEIERMSEYGKWPQWRHIDAVQRHKLQELEPFTREEITYAREKVEDAGDHPNFGLFVVKVKEFRRRMAKTGDRPRARASPGHDPRIGHHPGSKEFGDGPQAI